MSRVARQKSKSGIYHIMLRGTNRQYIFNDDEDYTRFLEPWTGIKGKADNYIWLVPNGQPCPPAF